MTWPIVLHARLEKGVLKLNAKRLAQALKGKRDADVEIVIERKHATRSLAQNAAYWGVYIKALCEHTGYTADEMHDILKAKFLPKKLAVTDKNGEIHGEFVIGGTTTRLNKIEFGEYMDAIRVWAAEELGVEIPAIESEAA